MLLYGSLRAFSSLLVPRQGLFLNSTTSVTGAYKAMINKSTRLRKKARKVKSKPLELGARL